MVVKVDDRLNSREKSKRPSQQLRGLREGVDCSRAERNGKYSYFIKLKATPME